MAVSVLTRPYGFKLVTEVTNADSIADSGAGEAVISHDSAHGLTTGIIIYIKSPVASYNGFRRVETISTTQFYFQKEVLSSDRVEFIKEVDGSEFSYWVCSSHRWSASEQLMIYKLSNNLWPVNSVDTARTMTVTDSNGYCAITASGDIKATGSAAALQFVKITTAAGTYDGVYQIISYTSDTVFTINLAYSAAVETALELGTSSIQYYYNNYSVSVAVVSGLPSTHDWTDQKEQEIISIINLIPDENNEVMFSVNQIIKGGLQVKNDLLLGTLPNNINAWTAFYITYGESYDTSDGSTLSTSTITYTSDLSSFEGYAVCASLPFKNIHSGAMTDYVLDNAKFLTGFDEPAIFMNEDGEDTEKYFFDISFILAYENVSISLKETYYKNDTLQAEFTTPIQTTGIGVYRMSPENVSCESDRVDLSVVVSAINGTTEFTGSVGDVISEVKTVSIDGCCEETDDAFNNDFNNDFN